ncbi:hypothetical protein SAMN05421788_108141 [Filimonas lacunae]|uniref:Uncharacterized protein n=1 Tax=Filimonas lacunae TaxID=477680 RepID=A0A173ME50_9BACT|nr:hypothetical protein [Filimonas lacunae]BAV05711.1 hypothetical protein FLA_1723 [Filimonas lacunae]SIT28825.1 hypothetical protein SAMN05421788_108141 [Filimonas lacunae]
MRTVLKAFTLCISMALSVAAMAQNDVILDNAIANPVQEYSALAMVGKKLLLVPQYPLDNNTYTVKACLDAKKAAGKKTLKQRNFTTVTITHLSPVLSAINSKGKIYQGFEAANAVGNTIFFSIETDESADSCYLIKGYLHKDTIALDARFIQGIAKVKCDGNIVDNAGFESLTYHPASGKLLAVFEFTNVANVQKTPVAFLVDTSLQNNTIQPVYIQEPVPFRITDVYTAADGNMYAINFWWAGEYNDYFACNKNTPLPVADSSAFTNVKNKGNCYGRILQMQLSNHTLSWTPVKEIGYDGYNWEGIVLYKNKFIIISDANKGKYQEKTTHMRVLKK